MIKKQCMSIYEPREFRDGRQRVRETSNIAHCTHPTTDNSESCCNCINNTTVHNSPLIRRAKLKKGVW